MHIRGKSQIHSLSFGLIIDFIRRQLYYQFPKNLIPLILSQIALLTNDISQLSLSELDLLSILLVLQFLLLELLHDLSLKRSEIHFSCHLVRPEFQLSAHLKKLLHISHKQNCHYLPLETFNRHLKLYKKTFRKSLLPSGALSFQINKLYKNVSHL